MPSVGSLSQVCKPPIVFRFLDHLLANVTGGSVADERLENQDTNKRGPFSLTARRWSLSSPDSLDKNG